MTQKIITPADDAFYQRTITFAITAQDMMLARDIASRYKHLVETNSPIRVDHQQTFMDIVVCHCGSCPLDLDALYRAPAQELYNDVFALTQAIDRQTCTVPGFTSKFKRV